MRIGLIGDTHDRLPAIAELVRQMQAAGVGMILHVGDYCAPFSLRAFEEAHVSLAGIFGKNDGDREGLVSRAQSAFGVELFESPHSFDIGGARMLLVHDIADVHERSVLAHDIVVHGHTHQQEMKTRGDTLTVTQVPFAKPVPVKAPAAAINPMGYAKYVLLGGALLMFLLFMTRHLKRREEDTLMREPTWLREIQAPTSLAELERASAEPITVHQESSVKRGLEDLAERSPDRVAQQVRVWMNEE